MYELQNTLETLRTCFRMLTFCDLVSGLILRMTKFSFDAERSKVLGMHFLDRFFKFVSLLVKNIVSLYMCYTRNKCAYMRKKDLCNLSLLVHRACCWL